MKNVIKSQVTVTYTSHGVRDSPPINEPPINLDICIIYMFPVTSHSRGRARGGAVRLTRFTHKVGQINHKWYKFGTFSNQNVLKSVLKSPGFVPFGAI